jgi:hypothetical protein
MSAADQLPAVDRTCQEYRSRIGERRDALGIALGVKDKSIPARASFARPTECPRGDLNPHALIRALAPQASASANSATRTSAGEL